MGQGNFQALKGFGSSFPALAQNAGTYEDSKRPGCAGWSTGVRRGVPVPSARAQALSGSCTALARLCLAMCWLLLRWMDPPQEAITGPPSPLHRGYMGPLGGDVR